MNYEKPVLSLLGATLSIVLGNQTRGEVDGFPETNFMKPVGQEDGLDD